MLKFSKWRPIMFVVIWLMLVSVGYAPAAWAEETPEHLWALAASAFRTEQDRDSHELLGFGELTPELVDRHTKGLAQRFSIHNREDLLGYLDWLGRGGHRREFYLMGWVVSRMSDEQYQAALEQVKDDYNNTRRLPLVRAYFHEFGSKGIKAWDFCRYIYMCRAGYTCGYMTEQEAWDKIMPVARMLHRTFESWDDLSFNYQVGRQFYCPVKIKDTAPTSMFICFSLKYNPKSPWQKVPWDTPMSENVLTSFMQPLIDFAGNVRNNIFWPWPE